MDNFDKGKFAEQVRRDQAREIRFTIKVILLLLALAILPEFLPEIIDLIF